MTPSLAGSYDVDIAIIGGGLMGASLALLLADTLPNKSILLCDRSPLAVVSAAELDLPSYDARSTALAPTSVDLLQRLGVWHDMRNHVTAINHIHVSDRGHMGWVRLAKSDNGGQPLGFVAENRAMGWALTKALAGRERVTVMAPTSVTHITPVAGAARLTFNDGQTRLVALAIVADGAESSLRSALGIAVQTRDYQQSAIVANVVCEKPHQGEAFERFTRDGPLAMLPLGGAEGSHCALVWARPAAQVEASMAADDPSFLQALQRQFGFRLGRLCAVSPRHHYPLRLQVATEQVRNNIVLMGNAAHFLHPVAGQGYNLAVRDGLRLAEVLRRCHGDNLGALALLQHYEKQQLGDQQRTIFMSDSFNRLFGSGHLMAMGLRNGAMFAVQCNAGVRSAFIRQMSGRAARQAKPWA